VLIVRVDAPTSPLSTTDVPAATAIAASNSFVVVGTPASEACGNENVGAALVCSANDLTDCALLCPDLVDIPFAHAGDLVEALQFGRRVAVVGDTVAVADTRSVTVWRHTDNGFELVASERPTDGFSQVVDAVALTDLPAPRLTWTARSLVVSGDFCDFESPCEQPRFCQTNGQPSGTCAQTFGDLVNTVVP
jgi:hypothetical protein